MVLNEWFCNKKLKYNKFKLDKQDMQVINGLHYPKITSVNWDWSWKAKLTFNDLTYAFYDLTWLTRPNVIYFHRKLKQKLPLTLSIPLNQTHP